VALRFAGAGSIAFGVAVNEAGLPAIARSSLAMHRLVWRRWQMEQALAAFRQPGAELGLTLHADPKVPKSRFGKKRAEMRSPAGKTRFAQSGAFARKARVS
jgi:hypothetical protein